MMALSYNTKMTEIPVKKTPGIQVLIADDFSLLRDRIKSLRRFEAGADYFLRKTEDFGDINIIVTGLIHNGKKR
jgi:hypothetical protein